jgi:hypothetical protein
LYVLEAALNYDFDYYIDDVNYERLNYDSVEVDGISIVNTTSMIISSDDVENAYSTISSYISGLIDSNTKIEIVDVVAYVNSSDVTFRAYIVALNTSIINPCSSFDATVTASVDRPNQLSNGCTAPGMDGAPAVKSKLNCRTSYSCGDNDGYYTNVSSFSFPSAYTASTYWSSRCSATYAELSGTTLNSRKSSLASWASYNQPTGKTIITHQLLANTWITLCNCNTDYGYYWDYYVYYGVFRCGTRTR